MNLQTFISETLTQIIGGVVDATAAVKAKGGSVSPPLAGGGESLTPLGLAETHSDDGRTVQIIDFDIALSVVEGKGTKGGFGIFVVGIGLGTQGESKQENASVSRVKFKIPVALPHEREGS